MDVNSLLLIFLVLYTMHYSCAQDSFCVEYDIQNIRVCGNASTWAVGTPYLTVTHQIASPLPTMPPYHIHHDIFLKNSTNQLVCSMTLNGEKCTTVLQSCRCLSNTTSVAVGAIIKLIDITLEKHDSALKYTVKSSKLQPASHTFSITECSRLVTNAEAVNVSRSPCGFDCTSEITCKEGYHDPDNPSSMYRCNAAAEWVPMPKCIMKMPETTTGATDASPVVTITPNGIPLNTSGNPHPNAGLILAVIIGLLFAAGIGVIVYVMVKGNQSAVIGGIVVGSLASAGMFVIIGFQIKQIKSPNTKAIQGKPEPDPNL